MQLAVIGLGKLGSPFAALLAAKGNTVVGVDRNETFVDCLRRGVAPVEETGLSELVAEAHDRLTATINVAEAMEGTEVVFIVVPTPSLPDGTFDISYVRSALEEIGTALRDRQAANGLRTVVVVTSTVLPGATGGPLRTALEAASGLQVGEELGLCYSPEFIAIGSVIADMRAPDFILIGESSPWAGERVERVLRAMTDTNAPARRMSIVDAEVTKIAVNTFVTTKISYANMLAEICSRLPGANADVVAAAVGTDSRIGGKYLQPATAYGGPCFPRDNAALAALARSLGTTADIAEATDAINRRQVAELAGRVLERASGGRIAVLGLSYKPGTHVAEESFGVALSKHLHEAGSAVSVWDPAAMATAGAELAGCAELADSLEECVNGAAVAVITVPWEELSTVPELLAGTGAGIFDCWRMLPDGQQGIEIWHAGLGPVAD